MDFLEDIERNLFALKVQAVPDRGVGLGGWGRNDFCVISQAGDGAALS